MRIIFLDCSNSDVHFHNVLIISCSELRTMHVTNSTIKIGNAFKGKGRIGLFALSTIEISSGAIRPFDVNDINRSHCTRNSHFLVSFHNRPELEIITG